MGREPANREHTFRSGWTAIIRRRLPFQWLMQQALQRGDAEVADALLQLTEDGQLTGRQGAAALQIERDIVEAMFTSPRVVWDREDLPADYDGDDENRDPIWAADLSDDELAECLELAMEGLADLARFRDDGPGPGAGADSPDVVQPAKRARRAPAGKR